MGMGGGGMAAPPAEAAPEAPPETGEQAAPEGNTFFLPSGFPGSESLKAGDTVTLTVVGKTAEGEIEVSSDSGMGEGSWQEDLRATMSEGEKV